MTEIAQKGAVVNQEKEKNHGFCHRPHLGANLSSAIHQLCDLEQMSLSLVSVFIRMTAMKCISQGCFK